MELKIKTKSKIETNNTAEFIDCILTSAVILHKMHLQTRGDGSYAAHKALNELYDSLPDFGDDLAEKYQGYYGKIIDNYPSMNQIEHMKKSPLEFVTWLLNYVEKYRGVFGNNSMLQNIIDEGIGTIAEAKYKLTFLS